MTRRRLGGSACVRVHVCLCVFGGAAGECFLGTCAHPLGQSSNSLSHSLKHRHVITSVKHMHHAACHAFCWRVGAAWPVWHSMRRLLLLLQQQPFSQLNCTSPTEPRQQRSIRFLHDFEGKFLKGIASGRRPNKKRATATFTCAHESMLEVTFEVFEMRMTRKKSWSETHISCTAHGSVRVLTCQKNV